MLEKVTYKDILKFSWEYWRRTPWMLPVMITGTTITAVLDSLFPVYIGKVLDAINVWSDNPDEGLKDVLTLFAIFAAIELAFHCIRQGTHRFYNIGVVNCLQGIVNDAFVKVQQFSTHWHTNSFAGATVRKITRGMWAFDVFEDIIFMQILSSVVLLTVTSAIMMFKFPLVGFVTLGTAALYITASIILVRNFNAPRSIIAAKRDTMVGAKLADADAANMVVKSFGAEDREAERFSKTTRRWRFRALMNWQAFNVSNFIQRMMGWVMMVAIVGTAIYVWSIGQASAGDVVYVFTAYMIVVHYLRNIGDQINNLQRAVSEMEDVVEFWKQDIAVKDVQGAKDIAVTYGQIDFKDTTFVYKGQQKPLFDRLSLTIKSGEKVAMVGHSGSGKSSMLKLVQRLHDLDGGVIEIDGQDISQVTQSSLRQNIALVPQDPILFHRSIADNIAYGKPKASMDEIIAAAEKAYAHDFILDLPDGYNTLVGERGVKLSGGERQRVAIARAILADCPILILDEATSALDSISESYIQKALENLMEGRTTITVAHRLSTIRYADRILVFERGRIVEEGTHAELIGRNKSHYKELYEMQKFS